MGQIFVKDRDLPVIVGNCPECNTGGDRVLIMTSYKHLNKAPKNSKITMCCMICLSTFERSLWELTADEEH